MSRFDIAVVGCGNVSRMHFDGSRAHPDRVNVVAACDPDPGRREWAVDTYGVPVAFASLDELLDQAQFDVAVVLTPTPVREAVVRRLASAHKHVFVEKPFAGTYEEAERMVETCDQAGVRLSVNQNFRTHYAFSIARRAIADGSIGKPLHVSQRDLMFRQDQWWRVGTHRHALSVMGIHWLDGFRWMLGQEARSVLAQTWSSPAIECNGETDAAVQIAFDNGAAATYVQSFSSSLRRTETLVVGAEGTLWLDYSRVELHLAGAEQQPARSWENPQAGSGKPESAFMALDELLRAIEEGSEAANSGRDNLRTVAQLDACYRSAETQQPVALKPGGLL